MKTAGIIAEYDPFHAGHAWQLAQLRARGYERVVVCMSPSVVQRGGFSLLPPPVRVRAALQAGADLVLCLPAPYACQSAEGFAAAGVSLLGAMGCVDVLAFGAETADARALMRVAQVLLSPQFSSGLRRFLGEGMPFASARAAVAEALCPGAGALLAHPNNNLGVEYCKAIQTQGQSLQPLALPRRGAQHGAQQPLGGFASASHLRVLAAGQGAEAMAPFVPPAAQALYRQAEAAGQLLDGRAASTALLSRLRGMSTAELAGVRGMGEGLEYRLAAAVRTAGSLDELYAGLKTKRYAHARLRRLCLDAALGYTASLPALPPYLHVLGARAGAMSLCGGAALPCGPSLAVLERTGDAAREVAKAHAAAADLAALCRQNPGPMGQAYTQPPAIVNEM